MTADRVIGTGPAESDEGVRRLSVACMTPSRTVQMPNGLQARISRECRHDVFETPAVGIRAVRREGRTRKPP
jgi:hypothetical protein